MNEIELIRAQIAAERRRLGRVSQACVAAIRSGRNDAADTSELDAFCQASLEYLVFVLPRVSARDHAQHELLQSHLAADDGASQSTLDDMQTTLDIRRNVLVDLRDALADRRAGRTEAIEFVERCGRALETLERLPDHGALLDSLAKRHFAVTEWRRASFVDADSILEERSRLSRVLATRPAGIAQIPLD